MRAGEQKAVPARSDQLVKRSDVAGQHDLPCALGLLDGDTEALLHGLWGEAVFVAVQKGGQLRLAEQTSEGHAVRHRRGPIGAAPQRAPAKHIQVIPRVVGAQSLQDGNTGVQSFL